MSSSCMTPGNRTSWRELASFSLTSDMTTDKSGCLSTKSSVSLVKSMAPNCSVHHARCGMRLTLPVPGCSKCWCLERKLAKQWKLFNVVAAAMSRPLAILATLCCSASRDTSTVRMIEVAVFVISSKRPFPKQDLLDVVRHTRQVHDTW